MGKEIDFKNRDRFIQLGITISVLRKMRGMSQEQLAAEAMMSRSHLSAIEAPNIVRPFSVEVLFNIADALKVEPGDLLNTSKMCIRDRHSTDSFALPSEHRQHYRQQYRTR